MRDGETFHPPPTRLVHFSSSTTTSTDRSSRPHRASLRVHSWSSSCQGNGGRNSDTMCVREVSMLTLIFLLLFTTTVYAGDYAIQQRPIEASQPGNFVTVRPSPGILYSWEPGTSNRITATDLGAGISGYTARNSSGVTGQGFQFSGHKNPAAILSPRETGEVLRRSR